MAESTLVQGWVVVSVHTLVHSSTLKDLGNMTCFVWLIASVV